MVEEPVLRPAQPADFTFCERTYFAGMAAIIETLRLDMARQRDSFRQQWQLSSSARLAGIKHWRLSRCDDMPTPAYGVRQDPGRNASAIRAESQAAVRRVAPPVNGQVMTVNSIAAVVPVHVRGGGLRPIRRRRRRARYGDRRNGTRR